VNATDSSREGSGRLDEPEPRNTRLTELIRVAEERERIADERERIADERERIADERERIADERERIADERGGSMPRSRAQTSKTSRWPELSRLGPRRDLAPGGALG